MMNKRVEEGRKFITQISQSYAQAKTETERYEHQNAIVQIHIDIGSRKFYNPAKRFIQHYLQANEEKESEYEQINWAHIEAVAGNLEPKSRAQLLRYAERQCRRLEIPVPGILERIIGSAEMAAIACQRGWWLKPASLLKYLLLRSTSSLFTLVITVVAIFLVQAIILFPSSLAIPKLYTINETRIYVNEYLNHGVNMITLWCSPTPTMSVAPTGMTGAVIMLLGSVEVVGEIRTGEGRNFANHVNEEKLP